MNKNTVANQNSKKNSKGFTLFIALIVSSILLSVGFSIGNIILKQTQLSTAGRESQIAFYAADSAAECALYWDRKNASGDSVIDETFGTSTDLTATRALGVKCGSGADDAGTVYIASKEVDATGNLSATTTMYIVYKANNFGYNSCAKVIVGKTGFTTVIDARGYNSTYVGDMTSGITCDVSNPRTVERGLLLMY